MNELVLKDIHLPDAILWWPPAAGWWIVLVLFLLAVFLAPRCWRCLRHKPIKMLSLMELNRIQQDLEQGQDAPIILVQISTLLRRTAMSYSGRGSIASLAGEPWVARLNELAGSDCFDREQSELLGEGQYRRVVEVDINALLESCEKWIKALPARTVDAAD